MNGSLPAGIFASDERFVLSPHHDSPEFKPVFVVGPPRSGTTLLAAMLDRHPDMAVPPETYLFFVKDIHTTLRSSSFTKEQWAEAFSAETRVKEIGAGLQALLQNADRSDLNIKDLIRLILEQYATKAGKKRVGEKTPQHLTFVPEIMTWYPGSKVICIIRDGRDMVESLMRMPWAPRNLRRHCHTWIAASKLVLKYQKQYPDRLMLVRFEDLVTDPQKYLSSIDEFVGLQFHPNQIDHTKATGVMLKKDDAWMGRINKKLDPNRVGVWKKEFTETQKNILNDTMAHYLKKFGYTDIETSNYPLFDLIADLFINLFLSILYHPSVRRVLYFFKLVTTGANPGMQNKTATVSRRDDPTKPPQRNLVQKVIKFFRPMIDRFPRLATAYRVYRDNKYILSDPMITPMGFKFIGHEEMQTGKFERAETFLVEKLLPGTDIFINIGANIGYYCCLALQKKIHTLAFEPIHTNLRYLLKNIKANGWEDEIEIFPFALSDKSGVIDIYGGGTGASIIKGFADTPNYYVTSVPCTTLDKIVGSRFTGKKALIVMDIEGGEKAALEGCRLMLEQTPKPLWLVEILIDEHQPKGTNLNPNLLSTFNIFWERGYDAWTATEVPRLVAHDEVKAITEGNPNTLPTHNFLFIEKGIDPFKSAK